MAGDTQTRIVTTHLVSSSGFSDREGGLGEDARADVRVVRILRPRLSAGVECMGTLGDKVSSHLIIKETLSLKVVSS